MRWARPASMGLLSLCLVASAHAAPAPILTAPVLAVHPLAEPDPRPPKAETWHGLGMAAVTSLFTVLTTVAGVAISAAGCRRNRGFVDGDPFCGVDSEILFGPLIGLSLGPLLYDDLIGDGEGSLSSAYGGLVIGIGAMVIIGLATEGEGLVLGAFLPFAGAGMGYSLYAPHDARDRRRLEPSLSVQPEPGGRRRVTAGLGMSF